MDFLRRVRMDFRFLIAVLWIIGVLISCSSGGTATAKFGGVQISNISCNWDGITLTITSRRMFKGTIFSKLNYFNPPCRYVVLQPGTKNLSMFLPLTDCGNLIREIDSDFYVSNDMIIQAHQIVETDSDMVTSIVCKLPRRGPMQLHQHIHESHPDHYWTPEVDAWMELRMGVDRLGIEVSNNVLVGDEITLVINVKDDGKFADMQVEGCWAYEGEDIANSQYVLKLFDMYKCGVYDWISKFNLTKGEGNGSHSAIFGTIKAFKFPVSKNLHFTCSVQVCKTNCFHYCDDLDWRTRSNYLKRPKRQFSDDSVDQSVPVRHRLMKATIKALGTKLIEKNTRPGMSEKETSFRRRFSSDESVERTLATVVNEILFFNLTNNIVVFSAHEFNFKQEYETVSETPAVADCVSKLRFGIVTASLSFILFCLIITCIGLLLYLRKENKKHRIDNFLLYSLR